MTSDARYRMVALLPRLRAFARSLTRSPVEADELVQATCERALSSLATYREGTNFDAWMMRILRNLWIDGHRKRRNEVLIDPSDPVNDRPGEDGRDTTETRLTLKATRAAMMDLPEEQRSALVLVCVEGLSYRDAAQTLDVPIGTLMSRLARGRAGLASLMNLDTSGQPGTAWREGTRP